MSDDVPISLGAARALKTGDNRAWTPVDCLLDCIKDIESGATPTEKLLILRVSTKSTDGADVFNVGYNAAALKASEIIAVLEVAKMMIFDEMGY